MPMEMILLGAHRGREHAVLRTGAVLVGRLGVGPALPADRRAVPRRDGGAAHGLRGLAARADRRERARVLLRRVAGGAVALHDRVLRRVQGDAAGDPVRPEALGPQLHRARSGTRAHWQQILYQLRLLPKALSQLVRPRDQPARSGGVVPRTRDARRVLDGFRARDLGDAAVLVLHAARARRVRDRRAHAQPVLPGRSPAARRRDPTDLSGDRVTSELPA